MVCILNGCYGNISFLQQIQHPTASLLARVATAQVRDNNIEVSQYNI